jgi:hypothetical protein
MKSIAELANIVLTYSDKNPDSRLTYHCVSHKKWVLNEINTICNFEGIVEHSEQLEKQIEFLHNHKYNSRFSILHYKPKIEENLNQLQSQLE